MRVLLLGGGAREHALAFKLAHSPLLTALHAAPGNPGIAGLAACHAVRADDAGAVLSLARQERADLVVVGPEAPLVAGVADCLREEGIPVFGPGAAAAQVEGSKAFAKELMREANVPTAAFEVFDDPVRAEAFAASLGRAVVKADGLAAGKGVLVCGDAGEARSAVRALMREGAVGPAGRRVVVEERLEGWEVSAIALCDGKRFAMLPASQDHKRLLDGDRGPNTGGMGAISPVPEFAASALEEVGRQVVAPVLEALERRGAPFIGALYAGLMMTRDGLRVLEFNCRMGDPETQPLVLRLDGDLLPVLASAAAGRLEAGGLRARPGAAVAVVLASAGYPGSPRMGDSIGGLERLDTDDGLQVFHAGTRRAEGRLVTAGGRVLTVCALGGDLAGARARAYAAAEAIRFDGMQLRRDIGLRPAPGR